MGKLLIIYLICLSIGNTLTAMNTTHWNEKIAYQALNTIEHYNNKNVGETAIDPDKYLRWLMPMMAPSKARDENVVYMPLPEELHAQTKIIALSATYHSTRLQKVSFGKHQSNETIIQKLIRAQVVKSIPYGHDQLEPLWFALQEQIPDPRLNQLLGIAMTENSIQNYWKYQRFLIAALVIAGANPNYARHSDGMCPLGHAVLFDDVQAATLLLSHKADPNITPTSSDLKQPIIWYAHSNTIVQLLIQHNAQIPKIEKDNLSGCDRERYEELSTLMSPSSHPVIKDIV